MLYKISDEKLAAIVIFVPLSVISVFSGCFFNFSFTTVCVRFSDFLESVGL